MLAILWHMFQTVEMKCFALSFAVLLSFSLSLARAEEESHHVEKRQTTVSKCLQLLFCWCNLPSEIFKAGESSGHLSGERNWPTLS